MGRHHLALRYTSWSTNRFIFLSVCSCSNACLWLTIIEICDFQVRHLNSMLCMNHPRPRQSSEIAVYAPSSCSVPKTASTLQHQNCFFETQSLSFLHCVPQMKAAAKHSPETNKTDHMEAVYFQDFNASVRSQFYWSCTSSSQRVPAQFSPKP